MTKRDRLRGRAILLRALVALGLCPGASRATTIILADFENSIVEGRQVNGGTYKSKFRLFRNDSRTSVFQDLPQGPAEIDVTSNDLENIWPYLNQHEKGHGGTGRVATLEDGTKIRPGDYQYSLTHSHVFFHSSAEGRNYLLENFKAAEARAPAEAFKGPFWNQMVKILSHPDSAKSFGIMSGHGHAIREWEELFSYFIAQGYVKYHPNYRLFHSVNLPIYDKFELNGAVAVKKVKVIAEIVKSLERVALTDADLRLNAEGDGQDSLHYVILAEDNQETVERAAQQLRMFHDGANVPVKFGLFNLGYKTEIKNARRPQFSIVTSSHFRAATEDELVGEFAFLKSADCETASAPAVAAEE